MAMLVILAGCQAGGSGPTAAENPRTPVVLFPAFHLTKLLVTVHDQVVAPECPRSGSFEDWYRNDHPSAAYNQVCQDKLLTLQYRLYQSAPSTYLSVAAPTIFGNRETILEDASTGRNYTPRDYHQLITDAKLDWTTDIAAYYLGFDKTADPGSLPDVDVYAEKDPVSPPSWAHG